jgi:hypothetical protein
MSFTTKSWPDPLSDAALHGLAGEFVRTIEPHTESDPAALLMQFLVAFGNVIGPGPHWLAEADRHALNLYSVLVGESSKDRKGTSWAQVRALVSRADESWGGNRIQTGLSIGESLVHAVCDSDCRLLVVEPEFGSPLRMIARDGSTLSHIVRQAWAGSPLRVWTKQGPETVSEAHVSIIGHISRDELNREDAGSRFWNPFLWACVRRSKILPEGSQIPEGDFDELAAKFKEAVDGTRFPSSYQLRRDEDARELWHSVYPDLSEGKGGLVGAVTSRAEAQVMRIACLYALLDGLREVRREHLLAGLAVWKYCEASARYIFGDALGDPLADTVLQRA